MTIVLKKGCQNLRSLQKSLVQAGFFIAEVANGNLHRTRAELKIYNKLRAQRKQKKARKKAKNGSRRAKFSD